MSRPAALTSVADALAIIAARTSGLAPESMPLAQAAGRTLRAPLVAPCDLPRADRATMDGYAVHDDEPATSLRLVRTAATDDAGAGDFDRGETIRVSTGTALSGERPLRVVPFELVRVEGDRVLFEKLPDRKFVHRRGADARAGAVLLREGAPMTPGAVALFASLGLERAPVSPKLRIRHYTTGDEVVAAGAPLPPGSVYDSNGPLLESLLASLGETVARRHLREDYAAASDAVRADTAGGFPELLLVSGGVGPGTGDFTEKLLRDLGYDIALRGGVNVRPGKPLVFGARPGGVAFGLPGNPLSQWASFHTFVLTAIRRLRGEAHVPTRIRAMLTTPLDGLADPRPTFHPATVFFTGGEVRVTIHAWTASGNVSAMAEANAMVFVPAGVASLSAGDTVDAELLPTSRLF